MLNDKFRDISTQVSVSGKVYCNQERRLQTSLSVNTMTHSMFYHKISCCKGLGLSVVHDVVFLCWGKGR